MSESRFCSACGNRIDASAHFCSSCGHDLRPRSAKQPSTASVAASGGMTETLAAAQQRLITTSERVVFRWILGSSLALALGSIGPWATATLFGVTASESGLRGGGWVTLVAAGAAILLLLDPDWLERAAWLFQRRLGLTIGLAILAVVICVLNLVGVEQSGLAGIVHPGWGLYLATFSSISLAVWAWTARAQRRGASLP
jgi:hypothetical protein